VPGMPMGALSTRGFARFYRYEYDLKAKILKPVTDGFYELKASVKDLGDDARIAGNDMIVVPRLKT